MRHAKLKALFFLVVAQTACMKILTPEGAWTESVNLDEIFFNDSNIFAQSPQNYLFSLECGKDVGFFSSEIIWRPFVRNVRKVEQDGSLEEPEQEPSEEDLEEELSASCSGVASIIIAMGSGLWFPPQEDDEGIMQDPQRSRPLPSVAPTLPPADKTLVNVKVFERPVERDYCGRAIVLPLFSFGFIPCTEHLYSAIDLSLSAHSGKVSKNLRFGTSIDARYGFISIFSELADITRPDGKKRLARSVRRAQDLIRSIQNHLVTFVVRLELLKDKAKITEIPEKPPSKEQSPVPT